MLNPDAPPPVFVAVIVVLPALVIFIPCDVSTPAVKEADGPVPELIVPEEERFTVPVKVFGPLLQILLFTFRQ